MKSERYRKLQLQQSQKEERYISFLMGSRANHLSTHFNLLNLAMILEKCANLVIISDTKDVADGNEKPREAATRKLKRKRHLNVSKSLVNL